MGTNRGKRDSKPKRQDEMTERAKQRPSNYSKLSGQEQWEVDKELGILDWDGPEAA